MIGVFVHYEVIPIVPAPVRADKPIPRRDFKIKPSGEPKTVVIPVDPYDVILIVRTKMREMPVRKGMVEVIAFVVRRVVTLPMIVVDVPRCVDFSIFALLRLCLRVGLALGRGGGILPRFARGGFIGLASGGRAPCSCAPSAGCCAIAGMHEANRNTNGNSKRVFIPPP
jgi:hypothetical protein